MPRTEPPARAATRPGPPDGAPSASRSDASAGSSRRRRLAVAGVALAVLPLALVAGCDDGNGNNGDGGNRPDPRQVNPTIQPVTPGPATDGATPSAKVSPQTTGENTSPGAAGK